MSQELTTTENIKNGISIYLIHKKIQETETRNNLHSINNERIKGTLYQPIPSNLDTETRYIIQTQLETIHAISRHSFIDDDGSYATRIRFLMRALMRAIDLFTTPSFYDLKQIPRRYLPTIKENSIRHKRAGFHNPPIRKIYKKQEYTITTITFNPAIIPLFEELFKEDNAYPIISEFQAFMKFIKLLNEKEAPDAITFEESVNKLLKKTLEQNPINIKTWNITRQLACMRGKRNKSNNNIQNNNL